jgi:hypothetical protein
MRTNRVIACAIVKDEPRLAETIENVRDVFGGALAGVMIHDTGSSPPEYAPTASWVQRRGFDDFSGARNACLDAAEVKALATGAEWLFMFSGGAVLSGPFRAPDADRHAPALAHTERLGSTTFAKCTTVRVGSGLRYAGLTHEVITVPGGAESLPHCGLTVDYTADWSPEKKRARWLLDVKLLEKDYTPRGRYYLAQSYDCLGMNQQAFWHYAQRLEMRGYEPERRQAAVGAVRVAPTMALAWWASIQADSADACLALAERRLSAHDTERAKASAEHALNRLDMRSLFARVDLVERCKEILSK